MNILLWNLDVCFLSYNSFLILQQGYNKFVLGLGISMLNVSFSRIPLENMKHRDEEEVSGE